MRLLLVEDDVMVASGIKLGLTDAGYAVDWVGSAERAIEVTHTESFDVAVVDIGLPHMDGLTLTQSLRKNGQTMPVLILTARDALQDRVQGLDMGADDYMVKPFELPELLARLRGLIRRASGLSSPVLVCGPVELDTRSGRVTLDGQTIALTSHEFKVLAYLMHHAGAVVSRTELTEHIYAQDFERDSNTIEVFVGRLRKKLPPDLIETVRGLGYRLVVPA